MSWQDNLSASQVAVVQEILDQIPETMGFRNVFVGILDQIGGEKRSTKNFLISTEYGDFYLTDDEELAGQYASDAAYIVIDLKREAYYGEERQVAEAPPWEEREVLPPDEDSEGDMDEDDGSLD